MNEAKKTGFCIWCDKISGETVEESMRPILCSACIKIPAARTALEKKRKKLKLCIRCGGYREKNSAYCDKCQEIVKPMKGWDHARAGKKKKKEKD